MYIHISAIVHTFLKIPQSGITVVLAWIDFQVRISVIEIG